MSNKFSIINRIDLDKVNEEIHKHIMRTGEINPYIFMNKETSVAIDNAFPESFIDPCLKTDYQGAIGYWECYKIFINNDLEFGEVEIR